MKDSLKKLFSKRALIIVLVALLILSVLNTYLILEGTRSAMRTNVANYDFVLSQEGSTLKLKNMLTGYVSQPKSAQEALNWALQEGNSVYINRGTYTLSGDVTVINKLNARIVSDEAVIKGNGYKIIIYGTDYTFSQDALISGLTIINGTLHVENSFATTITNIKFINASTGIEFLNTNTWSEYNKIEGCRFINITEGIVFRTPINGTQIGNDIGNATGSYASSIIERCSFNLQDFSAGIKVEQYAEFSDCLLQNLRFWMGENDQRSNQTALIVDGSMYQTVLFNVVFESFTDDPIYIFAIDVGENCDPTPILGSGVSFLGNWTSKIHSPFATWLSGTGTVFKREAPVPVGTNEEYGETQSLECRPLTISSFKPKIDVTGIKTDEIITIRVRIEYIDNTISKSVTRAFITSGSAWLSDDDMMQLFSSQSIIWAILVDAKSNVASTNAKVTVSSYGTAT
ncbi:MAG: hypothetical protein LBI79_02815 [Nitrososphaerota archaeon]|jgi:hypothetical protein|nr:hypothetical protein [Nitrososphaerota archaeon]